LPLKKIEFQVKGALLSLEVKDAKELMKEIGDLKKIVNLIETSEIMPDPLLVRADVADIFSSDGQYLQFTGKAPRQRNEQVILVVHAYGLKGATIKQIEMTTGIPNVRINVIDSGNNKHYFKKANNRVYLSKDGEDEIEGILSKLP
jgi:hypothetical protein